MDRERNTPLMVIGALFGAAGVALAARGSHGDDGTISIAANFLLLHAPALIAIGVIGATRWISLSGWLLAFGVVVFAGDLTMRSMMDHSLFPMAAPLGGGAMIAGWLAVAATLALGTR